MCSENDEQVVFPTFVCVVNIFFVFQAVAVTEKFNTCLTQHRISPRPNAKARDTKSHGSIHVKQPGKVFFSVAEFKGVLNVVERKIVPEAAKHLVEQVEQEVALVLEPHAVVDPGTVVVQHDHAPPARLAVVGPSRFHEETLPTLSAPHLLHIVDRFRSVSQRSLQLLTCIWVPLITKLSLGLSLLQVLPELLDHFNFLRTICFANHSHCVIKKDLKTKDAAD